MRSRVVLFALIVLALTYPCVCSAAACSICQIQTWAPSNLIPNSRTYFLASCVASSKGDLQNCQVVTTLDDPSGFAQSCISVTYVSYQNDCYGTDLFQPSSGGTLWTHELIDSARRKLLMRLANLHQGI